MSEGLKAYGSELKEVHERYEKRIGETDWQMM